MLGNALAISSAFTYAIVYLAARRPDCDALSYSYQGNLIAALLVDVYKRQPPIPGRNFPRPAPPRHRSTVQPGAWQAVFSYEYPPQIRTLIRDVYKSDGRPVAGDQSG